MTNQELYKGYSAFLDTQYFGGINTADNKQLLKKYLQSVDISELVLLSGETQWHADTAYEEHIKRINENNTPAITKQFFALKVEGAPNNTTLFDTFALPRELAIEAYRQHKDRKDISVVLRDVNPGTVAMKIDYIDDEKEGEHILTARLYAAQTYDSILELSQAFQPIISALRRSTNGLSNVTVENKVDEYGNLQPHLYLTAESFDAESGLVYTFDPTDPKGVQYSPSDYMGPPATPSEIGIDNIYNIKDVDKENPFKLKYKRPVVENIDAEIDDMFSTLDVTQSQQVNSTNNAVDDDIELASEEGESNDSVHDDIDDSKDETEMDEIEQDDKEEVETSDIEVPEIETTEVVVSNTENDDNILNAVKEESPSSTPENGKDEDMPKTLLTIQNLDESTSIEHNSFYHALTKMYVENNYTGHRRNDILHFLKSQEYVVGESHLSDEQNSLLRKTHKTFSENILDLSKENSDGSTVMVNAEHKANPNAMDTANDHKETYPELNDDNEREVENSIDEDTPSTETNVAKETDTAIDSSASNAAANETNTTLSEDNKAPNNEVETEAKTTPEQPAEKVLFDLAHFDNTIQPADSHFYAWLKGINESDELHEQEMFNIGRYLVENGYDKNKHKPRLEQLARLKAIHFAFNDDLEKGLLLSDTVEQDATATELETELETESETESEHHISNEPENTQIDETIDVKDDETPIVQKEETPVVEDIDTSSASYQELLSNVKSSLLSAMKLNHFSGDYEKDITLHHQFAQTPPEDITDELYRQLYEAAVSEIHELKKVLSEEPLYQIEEYKGDLINDNIDPSSANFQHLLKNVKSSLQTAMALNLFSGNYEKDIALYHQFAQTPSKDINDDLYGQLYETAVSEIRDLKKLSLDGAFYQINAFKGDLMEVIHFSDENWKENYVSEKQRDGYIVDTIPIDASQITCKIESAEVFSADNIKVQASVHGPTGINHIHNLFEINPGLSTELKENCGSISGLSIIEDDNGRPCIEIICESCIYMPGTILRPTKDQFLSAEKDHKFTVEDNTPTMRPIRKKAPLLIDGITPDKNYQDTPVQQSFTPPANENNDNHVVEEDTSVGVRESTQAEKTEKVTADTEEKVQIEEVEKVEKEIKEDDERIDIDEIESHFDQLGL